MSDFMKRRQLIRLLEQSAKAIGQIEVPEKGWITTMRQALGMSAEQVARRKGVTRNAVYQAERSEKEGAVSLNQMEKLAEAMGGRFVYAIVPNKPIESIRYTQALKNARAMAKVDDLFASLSQDDKQDWIDDTAAQLLHDMPTDFWEMNE